jgi:hypothetical protein
MTLKIKAFPLVALTIAVVAAAPAVAQGGGQMAAQQGAGQQQMGQQMAQQQQLAQMDQSMQRLHQLEQQATDLAQNMAQRAGQAGAGPLGPGDQAMQQLCDSVANLAGGMAKAMDRIHQNLRDPALVQDQDMLRDMDRLRLHVEDMAGPLEDALQTMTRMQDRLHQPGSGS